MEVVYALIPMMLFFGFIMVVVFIWMAKAGQFDDMDGAANSIFMDDEYDEEREPTKKDLSTPRETVDEKMPGGGKRLFFKEALNNRD